MNNGTEQSFSRIFKKEISVNPHLQEASELGKLAADFANRLEADESARGLGSRLVEKALKILPLLYRASTIEEEDEAGFLKPASLACSKN